VLVVVTDPIMLEVQPAAATVSVGNTQPFTVIARNSAGQIVAHGPVTWASANISIATINANGVATGRATGTTFITAAASGVTSAPATLNVTNACADPNGWLRATSFDAVLEYDWVDSGLTDGGFRIDAEYHAKVTARLTLLSATPFQIAFAGDVTGTASFKESKRDPTTPNTTATLQGEGAMVPILGLPPTMILIIDPIACTFTRDAGVSLNTLLTEPDGRTTRADALVASVHQAPLPLTATAATGLGSFDARSQPWAALNRDKNSFVPRGFAHELTSSRDHLPGPAPTQASVLWLMTAR
jgi:hypothetical protein